MGPEDFIGFEGIEVVFTAICYTVRVTSRILGFSRRCICHSDHFDVLSLSYRDRRLHCVQYVTGASAVAVVTSGSLSAFFTSVIECSLPLRYVL
jgi:hypothetical protein